MSTGFSMLTFAAAGLIVTLSTLVFLLHAGLGRKVLDHPNHRSLHRTATPRIGGIGILAGISVVTSPLWSSLDILLGVSLLCYLALAITSLVDDVRGLSVGVRLLAHLAASLAVAKAAGLPAEWVTLAVLVLAWSANLFNFMDGTDGLAGGMTVIGFGAMALALAVSGQTTGATLAAVVSGAALGFLCLNFQPAKTFLGDSGSVPLGFLAAALGLHGWKEGAWSPVFPLLVFLPFWFDATTTLILRTIRGAKPWKPHREHLYQCAVQAGFGHRSVALFSYGLMVCYSIAALAMQNLRQSTQYLGLGVAMLAASLGAAGLLAAINGKSPRKAGQHETEQRDNDRRKVE